ncbi:hypothetical protein BsIDN1_45400 [Bacillus safensis]|uniref:Uncharacterized protein n=1 Tax=Bacillus safensis TaxID=561879 RepID=A0A5S9ME90_BACIA|nr:hypothetical protein BsIDN1_45400 [Bacillus safensis]
MAKSKYQLWISQGKDKLRFPVLPEKLELNNNVQNESIKVSKFGELTFLDVPGARQISFTAFFPKKYTPIAEYKKHSITRECNCKNRAVHEVKKACTLYRYWNQNQYAMQHRKLQSQ